MKLLTGTTPGTFNISLLLLRWIAGIILFVAGAGKVFGWFGGFGMEATVGFFEKVHISRMWAYISSYAELIGGFLLIIGLLTRPAALILTINMLVAVLTLGMGNFFLGGAAYPFTLMIICFVILLTGPMAYSVDALLDNNSRRSRIVVQKRTQSA